MPQAARTTRLDRYEPGAPPILPGVEVVRAGQVERFSHADPRLSSAAVRWPGIAVEDYALRACVIPRHERVESCRQVALRGAAKYEVLTRRKTLQFDPASAFAGGAPADLGGTVGAACGVGLLGERAQDEVQDVAMAEIAALREASIRPSSVVTIVQPSGRWQATSMRPDAPRRP
jgi:hypothetical protein